MKTKVRKFHGLWWVDYHFPFSGYMRVPATSWDEAMREAWAIERQKAWL
jgi:hypothetical protein